MSSPVLAPRRCSTAQRQSTPRASPGFASQLLKTRKPGSFHVSRQAHTAELPTRVAGKEVAVAGAHVRARRGARPAAQHVLVDHELAVVFADLAVPGFEP